MAILLLIIKWAKKAKYCSKLYGSGQDELTEMTHHKAKINEFAQFSKFAHTLAAILNDNLIEEKQ